MDIMIAVQDVCVSSQWLTAIILSLCCFLPSCLPAGQTVDYASIESVVTRQGDTALLRCTSDGISKGAWLNRSSIIFAGNDKWSVDPRVSIVSSGGEYSLQIQKVDVTDDGLYTCSVQSERNPKPKHLHLVVKVPPKIYDISSDITVNEGSNVSLICTASGKPDPTISWRHITPLARKYDSGEYLNITGITRDQAGDYECSAMNDIASPDTKTVKVIVKFAPAIHEMKSHGVGLGRTALLRCEAAAVPTPSFEWYKGEKRINKGQGIDIKNLSSRSVLTVTNMTEDRYGNYTCVAANILGRANASVPLIPIIEPTATSAVSRSAPNTAPYGSTGRAEVLLACRYLILALSSFISVY
ncbi:neuronal growth regulator 1 isoform X1 [Oncorhynchus nerka]|uniref:Neuronal growth regulator 1 n=4 Tax=Salmoninae TaxID=504568 RepID=A0A8U1EH65_SALNM|nr:neuronal growth regulator 1 isoform X1 [Oncorhynchus kisutch]XP_021455597.2 neuronal growth regulator 1 isoform X1 [Oncorhynchus mykiss]XP_024233426.1 neuronal growth regulator 1 isoform X1 [Oncorhynchus tshawytscha]XP_029532895.1 neuronal growth regulator 1 isoform X1 [Oncorhynchus nerka]XP_035630503.1 neuronal growth regulator 1 isoform X1 [Oncorhynchus keta]XP_038857994.1 neuronal growth regulator 1 isoform X2 [Salvelinus namaycush]XP_055718245.1 neuronal growth regulator 1 isoform X1 [